LTTIRTLTESIRHDLYAVREGAWRSAAVTAVAAAAAEDTFRLAAASPEYWNETSQLWKDHLDHVWQFLAGDVSKHYHLSRALAEYLMSPLNHIDGQDGPNDFDRPWTIAAYSAVNSVVVWGVDFATVAVEQVFECIDLRYGAAYPVERQVEVAAATKRLRRAAGLAIECGSTTPHRMSDDTSTELRTGA
jgi:hypothetical protein